MLNLVTMQGRIVRDPETRRTGTGKAVVSVTLAVERDYKADSGEKITDFFECVIWGEPGERFAKNNGKGDEVIVFGQLQQRKWEDKDGNKRSAVEVRVDRWWFGRRVTNKLGEGEIPPGAFAPPMGFAPVEEDDSQLPF